MSKINQTPIEEPLALALDGRIPPAVFLLTGCVAVIGCNSLVLSPIAPEVSRSLDASVQGVMIASAAFGLGTAGSALFLARHIDRLGAWRMLRLAFAALAAALGVSALAPVLAMLVAAQLVAGLAAGVALPAIYTNAATVAPAGRETETVGIVLTGWTLSLVAGVSLSAVLADILHWRAVFALVCLLAVGAFLILALNGRRDTPSDEPAMAPLAALRTPGLLPLLLACGAFMASFYGVYGYIGAHLAGALGKPVSANGLLTLVYGLGFGGAVLLDRPVQRLGAHNLLPFAFAFVAAIYLFMMWGAHSFGILLAVAFVWGLANHLGLNMLIVRLSGIAPARRGAIMGLNSATTYIAAFAGTLGFGPVYAGFGLPAAAAMAALLTLVAALSAAR
ncbi:MFS transporter [Nitratireductor sp. L1-7-SE]|uniref:MFS transporter n=1 Tax=Nitratireductor rhodophyticola TaxID=2854036 RepID=A0ABS7R788_9HYPH|nr:MFS transporter [Nitratireductor rhodophyticola]MBY8916801.1 MFS transporter [Nitratireductor rhodophyticola]MBY8920770.1 MFS transporter [Nitratireductor rhodophyticola]